MSFFFFLNLFLLEAIDEREFQSKGKDGERNERESGREFQFLTLLQEKNFKLLREKNNTNYAMKKKKTQSLVLFVKSTLLFSFYIFFFFGNNSIVFIFL